jgi:hypothetical protein
VDLPRPTALNPVVQRMVPILSAKLPHGVAHHLHLTPDLADVAIDPVQVVRIRVEPCAQFLCRVIPKRRFRRKAGDSRNDY